MRFDLIIVGGGLVGAGLAAALRHSGMQIALVDARLPSSDDPRLFALNSSSCDFLKNLDVWTQLSSHAAPIHQVHVSRQGHFGSVRLQREEVQLSELGHVIPAHYIESALNDLLQTLTHVTVFRPAKLKALTQDAAHATLTLDTESGDVVLQSSLVIGADGTESTVRKLLNIHAEVTDYEQTAIVMRTGLQRSHHQVAYERFTSDGAIAMLPLIGAECATIWSASSALAAQLMTLSDDAFLYALQKEFGYRLGKLQKIGKRHAYPLRLMRAEKMVQQNVFLLGNSAHTVSPIAAQGFNLAIYEVAMLVEGMMQKMANHETFTANDLHKISEQTQQQQNASIGVSHKLSTLFTSKSILMNAGLQLGMIGLDMATPIKKRFMERMLGRAGRIPKLLLNDK